MGCGGETAWLRPVRARLPLLSTLQSRHTGVLIASRRRPRRAFHIICIPERVLGVPTQECGGRSEGGCIDDARGFSPTERWGPTDPIGEHANMHHRRLDDGAAKVKKRSCASLCVWSP